VKRTLLIVAGVLGGIAALGGGLVALIFFLTSGVTTAADQFLALLGQGRTPDAYRSTASAFQRTTDEPAFAQVVAELGLDHFASSSWSSRRFQNDTGAVEGTITTREGGKVPLAIQLVKEGGAWKVLGLTSSNPGAQVRRPIPSDAQLRELVTATLTAFDAAVQTRDFTAFHAGTARLWQSQTSPPAVQAAFQEFIDKDIRLGTLDATTVVLDQAPIIDANGLLELTGYFVAPRRVTFKQRYAYEHPAWRLVSLKVSTSDVAAATRTLPPQRELVALVHASIAEFDRAVKSRDMGSFYREISAVWRAQTTPAALARAFKPLIDKRPDLSKAATRDPTFAPPPAIDPNGVLIVRGQIPLTPDPLEFQLKYLYEHPTWKLLGVQLGLPR
jgi:hypothetical protein